MDSRDPTSNDHVMLPWTWDRIMFRRCGAELTIEETIPLGAQRCRMLITQS